MKRIFALVILMFFLSLSGAVYGTAENGGFSVDVPSSWKTETGKEYAGVFLGGKAANGTVFRISSLPGVLPLSVLQPLMVKSLTLQYHPAEKIQEKKCRIGGQDGVRLLFTDRDGYRIDYALTAASGRIFAIIFVTKPGQDSEKEITAVRNSIQFLKTGK